MRLAAIILKYVINALMIAACIMALAGLAIGPVWEFKATVYFNEELADKLSGIISNGSSSGNTGKPVNSESENTENNGNSGDSISGEEIFRQALKEMAKDNVKVPVSLRFANDSFIGSLFNNNGQPVDDLIDSMVDEAFGEEFKAEVEKVKKSATKVATKVMVKQAVLDIKNSNAQAGEIFKDKSADEILADAGILEEEFDNKIETVYDVLTQGKTVEEAAESITDIVKDVYDKIGESDFGKQYPDAFKNTEENVEEIKKEISKVLVALSMVGSGEIDLEDFGNTEITDEMLAGGINNTVDVSGIFDKILLDSIKGILGSGDSAPDTAPEDVPDSAPYDDGERFGGIVLNGAFTTGGGIAAFDVVSDSAESIEETESAKESEKTSDNPGEEEDVYEEIKTMIKTKFKSLVSDEYKGVVVVIMRVIAVMILINALVWLYLLVKLIVNTITGKFGTNIKPATLLGWESGFNLVILPTIAFKLFTTENPLSSALNIPVSEIAKTVGLRFASGAVFGFYATLAIVGLWIVGKILNSVFKENKDK